MRHEAPQPGDVRLCAEDNVVAESAIEAVDGGVARLRVADQLRQHWIETDADLRPLRYPRVDAHARSGRLAVERDLPALWKEPIVRILRVDAHFDGVAALMKFFLHPGQWAAAMDVMSAQAFAFYRQHIDQFSNEGVIEAIDHVLPNSSDATAIASATAALRQAGPSADRIAPRSGKATSGEEFYFAAKIHLGDALFDAARGVPSGGVSAPVRLPDGVHLVVVRKNLMARPQPFADVRDQVLAAWVKDNAKRLTEANERFLRKRADIQFAPGFN